MVVEVDAIAVKMACMFCCVGEVWVLTMAGREAAFHWA